MTPVIDFDAIDDWEPSLAAALRGCVPSSAGPKLQKAAPEFVEDACELLFGLAHREKVIDATLEWVGSSVIAGYHGTRVSDAELASIRTNGLMPLRAESRRARLVRALSAHPGWSEAAEKLDAVLRSHGEGNRAGRRENQAHLTLSRFGLTDGFNHYLTHGAEFDQHAAHALLGKEGEELLRRDGQAMVIQFAVPGQAALDAAHPHFTIDDLRQRGEVPNIASDFLEAWSYRLAHPGFQCRTLGVDCGMVFRSTIPAGWIVKIDTPADL